MVVHNFHLGFGNEQILKIYFDKFIEKVKYCKPDWRAGKLSVGLVSRRVLLTKSHPHPA